MVILGIRVDTWRDTYVFYLSVMDWMFEAVRDIMPFYTENSSVAWKKGILLHNHSTVTKVMKFNTGTIVISDSQFTSSLTNSPRNSLHSQCFPSPRFSLRSWVPFNHFIPSVSSCGTYPEPFSSFLDFVVFKEYGPVNL